jgi:hypothetical protein
MKAGIKILVNLLMVLSVAAFFYGGDRVLQTMILSGAPNYSPEKAAYNMDLWMSVSGASLALFLFLLLLRRRIKA